MTRGSSGPSLRPRPGPLPTWGAVLFFLIVLVVSWWQTQAPNSVPTAPGRPAPPAADQDVDPANHPVPVEVVQEHDATHSVHPDSSQPISPGKKGAEQSIRRDGEDGETHPAYKIEKQRILDQDGKVIFSGTIDLGPTLKRIARGDANPHRHDGTTFQNRERRLPVKPSGYYKEYVHPTPMVSGPGPQRIIIGKDGDIWYTPDHYRTFQRIE